MASLAPQPKRKLENGKPEESAEVKIHRCAAALLAPKKGGRRRHFGIPVAAWLAFGVIVASVAWLLTTVAQFRSRWNQRSESQEANEL